MKFQDAIKTRMGVGVDGVGEAEGVGRCHVSAQVKPVQQVGGGGEACIRVGVASHEGSSGANAPVRGHAHATGRPHLLKCRGRREGVVEGVGAVFGHKATEDIVAEA